MLKNGTPLSIQVSTACLYTINTEEQDPTLDSSIKSLPNNSARTQLDTGYQITWRRSNEGVQSHALRSCAAAAATAAEGAAAAATAAAVAAAATGLAGASAGSSSDMVAGASSAAGVAGTACDNERRFRCRPGRFYVRATV